jgi:hypothetical protein
MRKSAGSASVNDAAASTGSGASPATSTAGASGTPGWAALPRSFCFVRLPAMSNRPFFPIDVWLIGGSGDRLSANECVSSQ